MRWVETFFYERPWIDHQTLGTSVCTARLATLTGVKRAIASSPRMQKAYELLPLKVPPTHHLSTRWERNAILHEAIGAFSCRLLEKATANLDRILGTLSCLTSISHPTRLKHTATLVEFCNCARGRIWWNTSSRRSEPFL